MSDEQLYNNPFRNSAGFRLMVLFGVFFITLLSVAILSQAIPLIPGISERSAMFISSATQCLLAFCLPAWLTAKFASPVPSRWLYLDNAPTLKAIAGVIIVYVLALPAMNQIIEWNASIHFPQALHEVEETLRKWEESNNGITRKLLESSSIGGIITGVCIVGILTGFSEEIFFRGALQGIFVRSRIGTAISVWVAAIIFSAIHFQFSDSYHECSWAHFRLSAHMVKKPMGGRIRTCSQQLRCSGDKLSAGVWKRKWWHRHIRHSLRR